MKSVAIVVAFACALPLAAAAQDVPLPRMLKSMPKGQWRTEILEHSEAKPGQKFPAMTLCTDNLMKEAKERQAKAKPDRECKDRLLKDGSDEAVLEMACPKRTVTTTLKRESGKSVLALVNSTGEHPMHAKIRYTHLGACREGQSAMSFDKDSEQCQKIRAAVEKMDPARQCASSGANRGQCESMVRQQIARAKAMCN